MGNYGVMEVTMGETNGSGYGAMSLNKHSSSGGSGGELMVIFWDVYELLCFFISFCLFFIFLMITLCVFLIDFDILNEYNR